MNQRQKKNWEILKGKLIIFVIETKTMLNKQQFFNEHRNKEKQNGKKHTMEKIYSEIIKILTIMMMILEWNKWARQTQISPDDNNGRTHSMQMPNGNENEPVICSI